MLVLSSAREGDLPSPDRLAVARVATRRTGPMSAVSTLALGQPGESRRSMQIHPGVKYRDGRRRLSHISACRDIRFMGAFGSTGAKRNTVCPNSS